MCKSVYTVPEQKFQLTLMFIKSKEFATEETSLQVMASHPMKGASAFEPASVVYVPVAAAPPSYYRYPKKLSIVLGKKQILFGVLCIVFSSVPVASLGVLAIISQPGIWSGILVSC